MQIKRLWWTVCTAMTRGGRKRADYARKHNIYAHVGQNVSIQSRVIPLYSELISFHNNVAIARNVDFCTHDIIHVVLNRLPKNENDYKFSERIGCIEIMDNVFVGSNSVIMYNTKIGPNAIIASGSIVTSDVEPNSVYAGCPAKKIGTFDDYVRKTMLKEQNHQISTTKHNQNLTEQEISDAWEIFNQSHS